MMGVDKKDGAVGYIIELEDVGAEGLREGK